MQRRFPPSDIDPEAMLRRAAQQLAAGDALTAQRTARTVEQIMTLDSRLKRRKQAESADQSHLLEQQRALAARQRDLDARHVALNQREFDLACEAQKLEELKESLEALYQQMYNKQPD